MLSIHNNFSAGAQNVTGAYVIIMLVLQVLVNNVLTWQSSCVIANNVICPRFLCDVISRSQAIITFGEIHTLLKEYRRTRKGMKDKRNRHGAVGKSSSEQHFRKCAAITFIV